MDDLAKEIVGCWERLEADRQVFKSHWQQCADYMLPERNDYLSSRTPGQRRMTKVYDATPIWANQQFAAGMHSFLTSSWLQWFSLWSDDDRLNAIWRVRAWLEAAGATMYGLFNSARHNFASQSHELYRDLGNVGTSVMAELDSARSGSLFSIPASEGMRRRRERGGPDRHADPGLRVHREAGLRGAEADARVGGPGMPGPYYKYSASPVSAARGAARARRPRSGGARLRSRGTR
jgi:hypothetical protein